MKIYNVICAETHYDQGEQPCIGEVHSTINSETAKRLFFECVDDALQRALGAGYYKVDSETGDIQVDEDFDCEIDFECHPNHDVRFYYFAYWDGEDSYKVAVHETDLLD